MKILSFTTTASLASSFLVSSSLGFAPSAVQKQFRPRGFVVDNSKMSSTKVAATGGAEIEVISQPDKEFLDEKKVFSWGTWGCEASKFPWTYDSNESAYLLKGQVTVTPTDGRKPATFGKGDFVTFPAGMSCTWDVTEPVQKHFKFY